MTRDELFEMLQDYHSMDEVVVLSPGNKTLRVAGIDQERTNILGKVVIVTEWAESAIAKTEQEILEDKLRDLTKQTKKVQKELGQYASPKGRSQMGLSRNGKRLGRPRKIVTINNDEDK